MSHKLRHAKVNVCSVWFHHSDMDIIPESQTTNPGSKVRCD